jgi:hypothetical protein
MKMTTATLIDHAAPIGFLSRITVDPLEYGPDIFYQRVLCLRPRKIGGAQ